MNVNNKGNQKKYATLLCDLSARGLLDLGNQLYDDWKDVASKFPKIFNQSDFLSVENEATAHHMHPADYALRQLSNGLVKIDEIYLILKEMHFISACEILEREMSPKTIESLNSNQIISQNNSSSDLMNKSNNNNHQIEKITQQLSQQSLNNHNHKNNSSSSNNSNNHNDFHSYDDQLIAQCESVLPVIMDNLSEIVESNVNNNINMLGRYTFASLFKRKLNYLRLDMNDKHDYLKELRMIKFKHSNLFVAEAICKTSKNYSLLYPRNDLQFTLHDYLSQNKVPHSIILVSILRDILNATEYLHSYDATKHPIYYGNYRTDSILIHVKDDSAYAVLADFKNTQYMDKYIEDHKLSDDLYYLGLVMFTIITWRHVSENECDEIHNNQPKDNPTLVREYRFQLCSNWLKDNYNFKNVPDKDLLSRIFSATYQFTNRTLDTTKKSVNKVVIDIEEKYAQLKKSYADNK